MMLGNNSDCICAKPDGLHEKYCDAYRLSEFLKKCAWIRVKSDKVVERVFWLNVDSDNLLKELKGGKNG